MKFGEWIKEQRDRTDLIGSFATSVAQDEDFPIFGTPEDMSLFVEANYGTEAVAAFLEALREFKGTHKESSLQPPSVVCRRPAKGRPVPVRPAPPMPSGTPGNFWAGHPVLDRTKMPLKPPGRN